MRTAWIFSRNLDLAAFLGPALVSFALLALGAPLGVLHGESPEWTWIGLVLLVDVAHVWATSFRTYLDPSELRRRPLTYAAVPLASFAFASLLYTRGESLFWRGLAYVAIAHFVRQQWGWVALYRSRAGDRDRLGRAIDFATVHLASLWPLAWWHAHLPRRFAWFVQGDLIALPAVVEPIVRAVYVFALLAYVVRAVVRARRDRALDLGKHLVVATTAACWTLGIVVFDSDYAFTVTNVLVHGIPYFALVYVWSRGRLEGARAPERTHPIIARGVLAFIASLWAIAYVEELLWDRTAFGDRPWLFGEGWELGRARAFVLPLLAVPQLTHYLLDGIVWRRRALRGDEREGDGVVGASLEAPNHHVP